MGMAQQASLFESEDRVLVDDERGSIVYCPAVIDAAASQRLFDVVFETAPWSTQTMWMYDRMVEVPRKVARYDMACLPDEVRAAKIAVERVSDAVFTSVSCNFYRDRRDSVAWHNDHLDDMVDSPTIALLSLGASRPMMIRSKAAPRSSWSVDLEAGSVLLMAGRSQEFWEHTIPKLRRDVDARISVAFRQRR